MSDARPVPRPTHLHNADHSSATGLLLATAVFGAVLPGATLGAVLAALVWRATRPSMVMSWLVAALGAATAWEFHAAVAVAWPWWTLLHLLTGAAAPTPAAIARSLPVEALLGPLLLVTSRLATFQWERTVQGQEWARYREMAGRKKALERGWSGPDGAEPAPATSVTHPAGQISLGVATDTRRPFLLSIDEIARHIFLPGTPGSGKTNTIACIAEGLLASGYGVVIVDCKGSGLGGVAKALAARYKVPLVVVDPRSSRSVGYDPCTGDAAAIANKIIGAFTFSGEAEIYKQVAMEVVPVICKAMTAANIPVTLDGIYEALQTGGLGYLGRREGADAYRARLEDLEHSGAVATSGYAGLQRRLGALMEGTFGDLFRKRPALDWAKVTSKPHVVYISLSATAAGEDVELFGRVITQDLKQLCDERMRAIEKGKSPSPVLICYDEFAALREATQIVDLLLQARQARAPILVATQFIPEEIPIRKPVLGAGVIIAHALEAEDAEVIARQIGTHTSPMLTAQIDYESGESQKGSVRQVEEFDIHPNVIKDLRTGQAAVLTRGTGRHALVKVHRVT
jgi:hypothetical protein